MVNRKTIFISLILASFYLPQCLAATSGAVFPKVKIGTVSSVFGKVKRIDIAAGYMQLHKGGSVYRGDHFEIDGKGFLFLQYIDGSRVKMGNNSRISLDDFEYNKAAMKGILEVTITRGCISYKSGLINQIAKGKPHSKFKTPSAIIEVRGSEFDLHVNESGATTIIHISGVLSVSYVNGRNIVILDKPGTALTINLSGELSFETTASTQQQVVMDDCLPNSEV